MANGSTYFKSEKGALFLTASYAEFYIPEYYFSSSKFAVETGNVIRVIGLFDVAFFENGKVIDKRVMKIPTWIELYSIDSETRMVTLPHSDEPVQCRVLKYNKGSKVMNSGIIEDASNATSYLDLINSGKIPPSVPYDEALGLWWKNQDMNHASLRVPSVIMEMILGVSYRDKNDLTKKFAQTIGVSPNVSQYAYKTASIREITKLASTFTAMTFEDFDSMVTASLNRARDKKDEAESPVEDVIKM